jgi:peptidoglycan/LPS O-acetylase OafA/YrhL
MSDVTGVKAADASSGRRWPALDGLRGIAVLMVLLDHGGLSSGRASGSAGVTLFFVLSGFLITHVIVGARAGGEWSMRRFVLARAARLVPGLFAMQVVVLTWWLLVGGSLREVAWEFVSATMYIRNLATEVGYHELLIHTWSLATEEQFYLLWPLLLPVVLRAPSPRRALVLIGLLSMGVRLFLLGVGLGPWAYMSLPANAFALLFGCAVVLGPATVRPGRPQRVLAGASLAALVSVVWVVPGDAALFFVPIFVAPIAVAVVVLSLPGVPLFELRLLRFVGRISYALYLWHWPVLVLTGGALAGTPSLPGLALSFVLATASTLVLEEPVRRRWRVRSETHRHALLHSGPRRAGVAQVSPGDPAAARGTTSPSE